MTRTTTDVVFGVTGQTFEIRALEGRPTAATFRVFNDYDSEDLTTCEFSGTATVDTTSTTVASASGPSQADPQRLNLTSSSGFTVDRKYLVSENGRTEWVRPIEVGTGFIRAAYPLKYDYTTAATVASTTAVATVDSTWVADISNISDPLDPNPSYRVRWAMTIGGSTVIAYSFLDLVRTRIGHGVDVDDLNGRAPGLVDQLPLEYKTDNARSLIDSAFRAFKAKLAAYAIDIDSLRNDELVDELVTLKALAILGAGGWKPLGYDSVTQYALDTSKDFETLFQQLVSVTLKIQTSDSSGAVQSARALPIWSK